MTPRPASRYAVGVAFLVVLALLVAGFVQYYRHALWWQDSVDVRLVTPAAGLSLDPPADVKLRGIIVGEVRSVSANGTDATLHIALDPDKRSIIPADVDAAIIPKTLFGQKYVDLLVPAHAGRARIADGAVIRQSTTSVELQTVFTHLEPVLDTLRPELVSQTLTAIATALDGRGAELGATLTRLDTYLRGIVPHTDTLVHDLRQLATTADVYAGSAKNLVDTLSNAGAISTELLVPHRSALDALLTRVTTLAGTATRTLNDDGDQIVALSGQALPVLRVLRQYATVLPCLVHGFVVGNALTDHALGGAGPYLRVQVDLPSSQNAVYTAPADLPSTPTSDANVNNLDRSITSYAPYCTQIQSRAEGVPDVPALSYNYHGTAKAQPASTSATPAAVTPAATTAEDGIGAAGSPAEIALARSLGSARSSAPLSAVLLGPLLVSGVTVP